MTDGVGWSVELWTGTIVWTGLLGLARSAFVTLSAQSGQTS